MPRWDELSMRFVEENFVGENREGAGEGWEGWETTMQNCSK